MKEDAASPWHLPHGGGLFTAEQRKRKAPEPTDYDRRQAAAREEIQLRRDAAELGDILLEIWEDE